jgi:hypothetical protein
VAEKGRTTLYLDKELIGKLIEDGWNVSALVSEALELVYSPDWEDMRILTKINIMENRKEEIEKELKILTLRTEALRVEDERLARNIDDTKTEWELTKRTTRLSGYITSLNHIIIVSMYDIEEIKSSAKDILDKIYELNPDFDLESHIMRFKTVMEY